MGIKQQTQTAPPADTKVAGAQTQTLDPVPQPPSQEAQQASIKNVASKYVAHMRAAHAEDVKAKTLAARIEAKVRHIAAEQADLERMEKERRDAEHAASVERDYAHADALMLSGVGVALPSVEVEMAPPAGPELAAHASVWNSAEMPGTGQFAALGQRFCNHCGQPVHPDAEAPNGVAHEFGVTCPNGQSIAESREPEVTQ